MNRGAAPRRFNPAPPMSPPQVPGENADMDFTVMETRLRPVYILRYKSMEPLERHMRELKDMGGYANMQAFAEEKLAERLLAGTFDAEAVCRKLQELCNLPERPGLNKTDAVREYLRQALAGSRTVPEDLVFDKDVFKAFVEPLNRLRYVPGNVDSKSREHAAELAAKGNHAAMFKHLDVLAARVCRKKDLSAQIVCELAQQEFQLPETPTETFKKRAVKLYLQEALAAAIPHIDVDALRACLRPPHRFHYPAENITGPRRQPAPNREPTR